MIEKFTEQETFDEDIIDISGTKDYDYDDWLEFFRKDYPAGQIIDFQEALKDCLPPDGYAALMRWLEIFVNPSKMEKLYKGRLDKQQEEDIMDIAVGEDDEAFYIALIRQNVLQLNSSNASQQEVARLTQNINIFRSSLRDIRSRKPKAGSVLDRVLLAANKPLIKVTKKAVKKRSTTVKKVTKSSKAAGAPTKKKTTKVSSRSKK